MLIKKKIGTIVRKQLLKAGYELVRYNIRNNDKLRRMNIIALHDINLVFDVGANIGQYSSIMRQNGYKGRIVSFEPLNSAYNELEIVAKTDPLWETSNIALGNTNSKIKLNISENRGSNSIQEMLPSHIKSAPGSSYIGEEEIIVKTIDSIIGKYYHTNDRLFLKIDTQGYEHNIIKGAKNSLDKIIGFQLELSVIPLYKNELLLPDMIKLLNQMGYTLWSFEPGFMDKTTGQILQYDGIFFKNEKV